MMDQDAKSFLFGSGTAAKFPKVGYEVEGTVLSWRMQQQRDYDTGELKTWRDGNPAMQLVITLATDEEGSFDENGEPVEVPNDDGERALYVRGALQKAIGAALRKAGSELEAGGLLTVKRIKDLPKTNPKFKAPFGYAAKYTPAAQNSKAATALLTSETDETGTGPEETDPWAE